MNIVEFISSLERNDYQRENFDDFLKDVHFSFNLPSIHIAGTNGKGSTAFYIKSIYEKAGYKVGLFNSPYFYEINEMISINDQIIDDDAISSIIDKYQKEIIKFDLSSFEVMTFVAFEYFKKNNVDIAIIECGMGGEDDATNIFIPSLSIITSISLEHTAFLGRSISEIAEQKGGIIKPTVPVLVGELPDDALNTINKIARYNKSDLKVVNNFNFETIKNNEFLFDYLPYERLKIKSLALYSICDACLAIEAVDILKSKFPINEQHIRDSLYDLNIPFRYDIISNKPTIILDGAHNPEAMQNLSKSIAKHQYSSQIHVLFCCFRDKNIQSMLETLSLLSNDVILTTFNHPRARTEEEYFLFAEDYRFVNDYKSALNELISTYPDDIILITGSLAFVSFVKKDFFGNR